MPQPRFSRLSAAQKEQLLSTARRIFARDGYHNASYNQMLQEMGLSKSSAYYTFADKMDVYQTVVADSIHVILQGIQSAQELPDIPADIPTDIPAFWRWVRRWLSSAMVVLQQHPEHAQILSGYAQNASSLPLTPATQTTLDAILEPFFTIGKTAGALRQDLPPPLARSLLQSVLTALDRYFLAAISADTPTDTSLDLYIDCLRRVFQPAPTTEYSNEYTKLSVPTP